jgi:hypothetical protein
MNGQPVDDKRAPEYHQNEQIIRAKEDIKAQIGPAMRFKQ